MIIELEIPEVDIADLGVPESKISYREFYCYWPGGDLGLHRRRQMPATPVFLNIALQPLAQIGLWVVDGANRQISLPRDTVRLAPATAAKELALALYGRAMDGRRLRQTAAAISLRSWLPTVIKLSPQVAPLAHVEPVASAISEILGAMRHSGELPTKAV